MALPSKKPKQPDRAKLWYELSGVYIHCESGTVAAIMSRGLYGIEYPGDGNFPESAD